MKRRKVIKRREVKEKPKQRIITKDMYPSEEYYKQKAILEFKERTSTILRKPVISFVNFKRRPALYCLCEDEKKVKDSARPNYRKLEKRVVSYCAHIRCMVCYCLKWFFWKVDASELIIRRERTKNIKRRTIPKVKRRKIKRREIKKQQSDYALLCEQIMKIN